MIRQANCLGHRRFQRLNTGFMEGRRLSGLGSRPESQGRTRLVGKGRGWPSLDIYVRPIYLDVYPCRVGRAVQG
jgi:hypothetical protein